MDRTQIQNQPALPLQTLKRLPNYYNFLRNIQKENLSYISAPTIAQEMGLNEVQVRKDLAAVSQVPGKPRKGFEIVQLMDSIATCLGYHNIEDTILVGAGKLGQALLSYNGFGTNGARIVAAFDRDETLIGTTVGSKQIFPIDKLPSLCQRLNIHIAIIAVPAQQAQEVCDMLVESGILAIWNFAPVHLRAPKEVIIQNENLSTQLALLSRRLADRLEGAADKASTKTSR